MATGKTTTDNLPSVSCRRLLAGTLYTSGGIMHQIMITAKGSSYHLEPFTCETHSTAYTSRAAIIRKPAAIDINALSPSIQADTQLQLLAPVLSHDLLTDTSAIISIDTTVQSIIIEM